MDPHIEGNGGNVKVMGNSNYFFVYKVVLLGVLDHCVKKNQPYTLYPFPINIIF